MLLDPEQVYVPVSEYRLNLRAHDIRPWGAFVVHVEAEGGLL